MKLWRVYQMTVRGREKQHVIQFPVTCSFGVTRTAYATLNSGRFSLYGLSEEKRKDIYFDRNTLQAADHPITFRAGYVSENAGAAGGSYGALPLVFSGSIKVAYTERQGSELVTHIEAFDGGFAATNARISMTTGDQELPYTQVMRTVMETMKTVTTIDNQVVPTGILPGVILFKPGQTPSPIPPHSVLDGNCLDILQKYLPPGGRVFIDEGAVNILGSGVTLPVAGGVAEISAQTGLLGVPRREFYECSISILFEPRIKAGQRVALKSETAPWVNGNYRVIGFEHRGTISGVESGTSTTDATLVSEEAPQ